MPPGRRYHPAHARRRPRPRSRLPLWAVVTAVVVIVAGAGVALELPGWGGSRAAPGATAHRQPAHLQAATRPGPRPGRARPATPLVAAATTDTPRGVVARWVQAENRKPGTRDWVITKPANDHQIEGYADRVSIDPATAGQVHLFVSTTAGTYQVQAFRMGYYGGDEGRLVWTSATLPGVHQPPCPVSPGTRMVECAWRDPVAVPISPPAWPQGDYLFKLEASTGYQSYIPLTVRDDASHAAYLVDSSVATWEAYNDYGGYSLYRGPNGSDATRASIVSFDRPYTIPGDPGDAGSGNFVSLELKMVSMMESLGLDVSYTTDVDVDRHPALLEQHRAFVTLGHDEYYSLAMRQAVQSARDAGVNLVFLGANALYRHVRFEAGPSGPDRREIDYKNPYADPLLGKDNADVTPEAWRDWPNDAPESTILGEMWQCNPVRAAMVITDPGSWLFAGTGATAGQRIPDIVGPEYDHFDPAAPNPGDVSVVAASPVVCGGKASTADMTYYSAPSGAGVWDTGTIDWVGWIQPYGAGTTPDLVTEVTDNVLAAFGAGPAGRLHPSSAGGSGGSRSSAG